MSKNPKHPPVPVPPLPPQVDFEPPRFLYIRLHQIDADVLATVHVGDQTLLQTGQSPVTCTTEHGLYIGTIDESNADELREIGASRATIAQASLGPKATCIIKVPR
jgi:hypothetical protein